MTTRRYGREWLALRDRLIAGDGAADAEDRQAARIAVAQLMFRIEDAHDRRLAPPVPYEERRRNRLEDVDALLTTGVPVEEIARRLCLSLAGIAQTAHRSGRRDLAIRFERAYRAQRKATAA